MFRVEKVRNERKIEKKEKKCGRQISVRSSVFIPKRPTMYQVLYLSVPFIKTL